jgi:D-amino peptidase
VAYNPKQGTRMADERDRKRRQAPPVSADARAVPNHAPGDRRGLSIRVYVKVDMDGVSGVVCPEQLRPGTADYEHARRLLMNDVKAVLDGAFAAGCTGAVIYDMHAEGRNLDMESLDRRAVAICGRPPPTDEFFYGLDDSFHALFLIGCHARAGARDALMPHTYDDDIASLRVNETELGEIGLEASLAGKFGVPLALVTGDSGAAREARELLGDDVEVVEVKRAVTATSAVCLPATRTEKLLSEAARRAVRRAPGIPPVVFQAPTALEVSFRSPESAAALARSPGIERSGQNTVRASGPSILDAYREFALARERNGAPPAADHCGSTSSSASP